MILIFGGAYQGKLEYAQKTFQKDGRQVYVCRREQAQITPAPETEIIYGLEDFVWACCHSGKDAKDLLQNQKEMLKDKILIACDVSQGIVPMDREERVFREMMGRTLTWLAAEADQVHRVFCGLGQRLK